MNDTLVAAYASLFVHRWAPMLSSNGTGHIGGLRNR